MRDSFAMETRRRWLGKMAAACTVAIGCGTSASDEPAAREAYVPPPAATSPQPWEPVDAAFTGCAGG